MDAQESGNPKPPQSSQESNDGSTRHHGKSRSHWGISHAVHGVGFVAKKVVNNRLTDSIWSLKRSGSSSTTSSSSHVPSDTSSTKKENLPLESLSDQTSSKPPLNVSDEQATNVPTSAKPSHEKHKKEKEVLDKSENSNSNLNSNLKPPDGSHVNKTNPNVVDDSDTSKHSGTLKPPNSSHVRPVNQHRWHNIVVGSNVIDHPENLKPPDGPHIKPATQQLWPSTVGSSVLSKNINPPEDISKTSIIPDRKMLPESSSDPTTDSQPSTPKKSFNIYSRGASPSPAPRGANLIPSSKGARGVSLTPANRGVSMTPSSRGVSMTPAPRRVDPPSVGPSVATRGLSPTLATNKGPNYLPPSRGVSPNPKYHTPLQPSSPTDDPNTVSTSKETDVTSPNSTRTSTSTRGVSPTPSRHSDFADIGRRVISRARGVSPIPLPSKPSSASARHFFSTSLLSMFTSTRKEKIITERKDDGQYLELLQNVQVQWQFLNAGTEAALDLQKVNAEKSLFDMWRTILELRDSRAAKKIDITLSILQLKLYAVLYRQMAYIDAWASIEKEHESALSVTVNDLVTRSILLPIIGRVNVNVDIRYMKSIFCASVQVMQTTVSSIQSTLAKVGGTRHLASELVKVALHERALLAECEIFLATAAPLQIEECSLRGHLIQLNRSYNSE
ncbi:hypothetical protein LXL04_025554 [Taraxacum kok-saghyz]